MSWPDVFWLFLVLANWLPGKTSLRKPNHGEWIVTTKPRPKSAYNFFSLVHCFIVCVCFVPRPYTIYFILLWHDIACLCWKCRYTPINQPSCTCGFSGHFPCEPGLSWCPVDFLSIWSQTVYSLGASLNISYSIWHCPTMSSWDDHSQPVIFHQPSSSYNIWPNQYHS